MAERFKGNFIEEFKRDAAAQINIHKGAHRCAVIQRIFHARIPQIEPDL